MLMLVLDVLLLICAVRVGARALDRITGWISSIK